MPVSLGNVFQSNIAEFLRREHGNGVLTMDEITDRNFCFAKQHLQGFLKKTQNETIERPEKDHGSDACDEVFKALREELERKPLGRSFEPASPCGATTSTSLPASSCVCGDASA